jgi:hypothetical protein
MTQDVRYLTTKLTLAATLTETLELLRTRDYQERYFAMNARGKSCSPLLPGVALSLRGAIICAAYDGGRASAIFDFMQRNQLLPRREPTREHAIRLVNQAIVLAEAIERGKHLEGKWREAPTVCRQSA